MTPGPFLESVPASAHPHLTVTRDWRVVVSGVARRVVSVADSFLAQVIYAVNYVLPMPRLWFILPELHERDVDGALEG